MIFMSLTSRIQALTTYANEVTGASDTTLSDAVATLAEGYGQGGGSLPSVISKIDGGSFTLTSDTALSNKQIEHSLGTVPKGFAIWTNDALSGTESIRYAVRIEFMQFDVIDSNNNEYLGNPTLLILYNGGISVISNVRITASNISQYVTSTDFGYSNGTVYFKANATYKWIAWA